MNFSSTMDHHGFRLHLKNFVGKLAHILCRLNYYSDGQAVYYHVCELTKTILIAGAVAIIA